LEVQGGQDYFRIVEGTCIIALCLSLLTLSAALDFELYQTLNIGHILKRRKSPHNSTPSSCVFLTFSWY